MKGYEYFATILVEMTRTVFDRFQDGGYFDV